MTTSIKSYEERTEDSEHHFETDYFILAKN